jgi:hypothetical protein
MIEVLPLIANGNAIILILIAIPMKTNLKIGGTVERTLGRHDSTGH